MARLCRVMAQECHAITSRCIRSRIKVHGIAVDNPNGTILAFKKGCH
jgi:hypothetical protein